MASIFSRRTVLAMVASAPSLMSGSVRAASSLQFRAIEVDVSPLRATGDTITAGWLAEALPAMLRTAFADRLAPGDRAAPVLIARIDSVAYGPPGSSMEAVGSTHDFIDGAAVVEYGRKRSSYPLSTSCGVSPALIDTPNGGYLRALALAGVFARFLPGQIGA